MEPLGGAVVVPLDGVGPHASADRSRDARDDPRRYVRERRTASRHACAGRRPRRVAEHRAARVSPAVGRDALTELRRLGRPGVARQVYAMLVTVTAERPDTPAAPDAVLCI